MITTAARSVVARNDWRDLAPRPLGSRPDTPVSVTVVVPAHGCQAELELALAALATQSHPSELLEVIVVDDRSEPVLSLPALRPATTELIRVEGGGHGSGHARDVGARQAQGDVVLFLDADIIAHREHVEAHARWHEITGDAVVLGFRDFVDVTGVTAAQVHDATSRDDLDAVVAGRPREPHTWIEQMLERTDDLAHDRDDLWRAVVGASVSTRRDLYESAGGFAHFPRRGIVDTEFGYRCFTAGGVIIPDRAAHSLHQGQRSFATRGTEIAERRAPLIANHIAHHRFRRPIRGRQWAVPYLHVVVAAGDAPFADVARTVDDVLANDFDDLIVSVVVDPDGPDADLFADYWQADGRVRLVEDPPATGFPSPATMTVPAGARLGPAALDGLISRLRTWAHGLISVSVTGLDDPLELWATRALSRVLRASRDVPVRETARELFGEVWTAGSDHEIGVLDGASDRKAKGANGHIGR